MPYHMFSATKLRALRQTHNLTHQQLATMLMLKSKGNLAMMENGSTMPQLSNFILIADFFGVSADWLLDRTYNVYDNVVLYELERKLLFASKYSFQETKDVPPPDPIKEWNDDSVEAIAQRYYCNILACLEITVGNEKISDYHHNREAIFSLPVRANIVFCFQVLKHFSIMLAKIIVDLNLDDPLRDISDWNRYISNSDMFVAAFLNDSASCWEKWNGYFTQYETKRAANSWLSLFKNCYNLLERYLGQKIDPQQEIFTIPNLVTK